MTLKTGINAALVSRRHYFQKHLKNLADPKLFNSSVLRIGQSILQKLKVLKAPVECCVSHPQTILLWTRDISQHQHLHRESKRAEQIPDKSKFRGGLGWSVWFTSWHPQSQTQREAVRSTHQAPAPVSHHPSPVFPCLFYCAAEERQIHHVWVCDAALTFWWRELHNS